jgi:hypothetical protein
LLEEPDPSQATEDERLAQLIGPARAMLARVDALALATRRSISSCLFGVVFCLSGAVAAGALLVFAPGYDKGVVVVVVAIGALVVSAGLCGYVITVLRLDLIPLNTFGQELRGGLRNGEHALFEEFPEIQA